jgi:ribosomal-protein-alanine N-acetyltransferase
VTSSSRVVLEQPSLLHERAYLDAAHHSRELHRGLVTVARTPEEYGVLLERAQQSSQQVFFVVLKASHELVGVVNLSEIDYGRDRVASLGYYAFTPHAGRGLMREGVAMAIGEAFGKLGLECLNANVQPSNTRSIGLLRSLGFKNANRSVQLKIGARWRAHQRWRLHEIEWRGLALLLAGATRVAER